MKAHAACEWPHALFYLPGVLEGTGNPDAICHVPTCFSAYQKFEILGCRKRMVPVGTIRRVEYFFHDWHAPGSADGRTGRIGKMKQFASMELWQKKLSQDGRFHFLWMNNDTEPFVAFCCGKSIGNFGQREGVSRKFGS